MDLAMMARARRRQESSRERLRLDVVLMARQRATVMIEPMAWDE
jgi:hypothetical protein